MQSPDVSLHTTSGIVGVAPQAPLLPFKRYFMSTSRRRRPSRDRHFITLINKNVELISFMLYNAKKFL
jgi:hypothetical protein